jgi:hypothetical protein
MPNKCCPRCGATFICQPEHPTQCQCARIQLSTAIRMQLHAQYANNCLCAKCYGAKASINDKKTSAYLRMCENFCNFAPKLLYAKIYKYSRNEKSISHRWWRT